MWVYSTTCVTNGSLTNFLSLPFHVDVSCECFVQLVNQSKLAASEEENYYPFGELWTDGLLHSTEVATSVQNAALDAFLKRRARFGVGCVCTCAVNYRQQVHAKVFRFSPH